MHSVPRTDLNDIRHSRMTAPNTQTMIGHCAASTASLVAAITPTLPVASLNDTSVLPWLASNALTSATICSMVSALWSRVNSITGITLQSEFSRPVDVGT